MPTAMRGMLACSPTPAHAAAPGCIRRLCSTRTAALARTRAPALRQRGGSVAASASSSAPAGEPSSSRQQAKAQNVTDAANSAPPPSPPAYTTGFTANYENAMTMAQLYAQERPEPIPLEQHEARRRKRDYDDICEAAARQGCSREECLSQLSALDALLPNIVNLDRIRASDWVVVLADVDSVAAKLVVLKTAFPRASALRIVLRRPKMLLESTARVQEDVMMVAKALSKLPDPDAIIEAVPDLASPSQLARALGTIRAAMPSADPLQVLQKNPDVLYALGGESNIEDSAEYGELSTKD